MPSFCSAFIRLLAEFLHKPDHFIRRNFAYYCPVLRIYHADLNYISVCYYFIPQMMHFSSTINILCPRLLCDYVRFRLLNLRRFRFCFLSVFFILMRRRTAFCVSECLCLDYLTLYFGSW